MKSLSQIIAATALSAGLLAGCGPTNSVGGGDAAAEQVDAGYLEMASFSDTNGAVIIGNPDAALELVEFASVTCKHCGDFHNDVLPTIKRDYIATGKLRYVFQEFPTPPVEQALAGFAIARCAGEQNYLSVLDDLFGGSVTSFIELGATYGLNEADLEACVTSTEHRRSVSSSVSYGQSLGVNSTPTLILNGETLRTAKSRTPSGLSEIIEAELARLSGDVPEADATDTQVPAEESTVPEGQ